MQTSNGLTDPVDPNRKCRLGTDQPDRVGGCSHEVDDQLAVVVELRIDVVETSGMAQLADEVSVEVKRPEERLPVDNAFVADDDVASLGATAMMRDC